MSTPNTPLIGPLLSVMGRKPINAAQAQLDWSSLQRFLGSNIPTTGIDAVAAGADNTGATDTTAALQSILNQGGNLFLRAGTYLITGLTVTGNCLIWSDSLAVLVMTPGLAVNALTVTDGVNVFIRGIRFQGDAATNQYGVEINNANTSISRFVWLSQCVFDGWQIGTQFVKVFSTYVMDSFYAANSTSDIAFSNCIDATLDSLNKGSQIIVTGNKIWQARNCIGLDDTSYAWPPPSAQVTKAVGQLCGAGAFTPLTWDTPIWNRRLVWDVLNPTRLNAPVEGTYRITAQASFAAGAAGALQFLTVQYNGGAALVPTPGDNNVQIVGVPTSLGFSQVLPLLAGDYLEVMIQQNSAGNQTTNPVITYATLELVSIP